MRSFLVLLGSVQAATYSMQLPRYGQQCFNEMLANQDRLEIGFEVVSTVGDDKLDCTVLNPDLSLLHTVTQERAAAFGFNGIQVGAYKVLFFILI